MFGRSVAGNAGIAAAKVIVKKAVFCIDNIDVSYNVDDIVRYVSGQSIEVLSCFEAKPRRRRNETNVVDRRAFRLCIREDQKSLLMDSSRWPDSVVISEWFFKSQQPSGDLPVEKRPCSELVSTEICSKKDDEIRSVPMVLNDQDATFAYVINQETDNHDG